MDDLVFVVKVREEWRIPDAQKVREEESDIVAESKFSYESPPSLAGDDYSDDFLDEANFLEDGTPLTKDPHGEQKFDNLEENATSFCLNPDMEFLEETVTKPC